MEKETFDMAVLAVGQRPSAGTRQLAELFDIPLNEWGFCSTEPLSLTRTAREGVFIGGTFGGLKDISESVTLASAAALSASRVIHHAGGSLAVEPQDEPATAEVSRQLPRMLIAICTCGESLSAYLDKDALALRLKKDPAVAEVVFLDQTCTATGWESLVEAVTSHRPNRLLVGACLPYLYARKLRELGRCTGLDPALMEVVDIRSPAFSVPDADSESRRIGGIMEGALTMSMARLRRIDPNPPPAMPIRQRALVVGGGIAGMTAALSIADHGFEVDLVEQSDALGGNLSWIRRTLAGETTETLLEETRGRIEKHPQITVHVKSRVVGGFGQVGRFHTSLESDDGTVTTLEHGTVILATGGSEAATTEYSHGQSEAVLTQKQLEEKLDADELDAAKLQSAVFIQCVGSREEPRNFCSRVCCTTTLKQALRLREKNPDLQIYVLYRDLMAYGFSEQYYTRARQSGIVFIQYEPEKKPAVDASGTEAPVRVEAVDPILGRRVQIDADLLVLATGVTPQLPTDLAQTFGAQIDSDGFFQEADWKWRPADALKEGVFACGLAHSPRSIPESIALAEAAAQRSLRILNRASLPAGRNVARVRHSICSLCQRCIEACPYEARSLDPELEQIRVHPLMCQGCGACAAVCPNDASVLEGFEVAQMFETIDAAIESMTD
jgi:heterodisulfide reductase subunit A